MRTRPLILRPSYSCRKSLSPSHKNETNYKKEIFIVPTTFYEEENSKKITRKKDDNIKLRIAIPGLIQEHRKDYNIVLPVFEKLFKQNLDI